MSNKLAIKTDLIFKVLIHLMFWAFWVGLPLLNSYIDDDVKRFTFNYSLLPVNIFTVPFFYLTSEYLTNKYFSKGKFTTFIIAVISLTIILIFTTYELKLMILKDRPIRLYDFRTLFTPIFVMSMATLFGLVSYLIKEGQKTSNLQQERLKSELSFLRSQISPHFIFNVLNSIVYLIRTKSNLAETVTIKLSELLRYMLYESDNKKVLLSKEVEYLKNYIELQKIRFGDDVKINLEIIGNFGSYAIEPMLLIPFVENAFKHGIGSNNEAVIHVYLNTSNENLEFEVRNSLGKLENEIKEQKSGIGLKNVQRRLELLYEDSFDLQITENLEEFKVSLKLELKN